MMNNIDTENLLDRIATEILPQNYLELAQEILKTLQNVNIFTCEAEAGAGKIYAYLLAAIVNKIFNRNYTKIRNAYPVTADYYKSAGNMPVLISTSGIGLQRAIVNNYIPKISDILMRANLISKPLTAAVRKGKEHYICDKRLEDCVNGINKEKYHDDYKNLISFQKLSYNRIDLDGFSVSKRLKDKICVPANCNGLCPKNENCRYIRLLEELKSYKHDFQICNHHYFFADTIRRSLGQKALIPNYSALIIDDAHKLVDVSRKMYSVKLHKGEVELLIARMRHLSLKSNKTGKEVNKRGLKLLRLMDEMFERLASNIPETKFSGDESLIVNQAIAVLDELNLYLNPEAVKYKGQNNLFFYIKRQLKDLKNKLLTLLDTSNVIYWLEPEDLKNGYFYLHAIPKDINKRMYKSFWNRGIPMVLTFGRLPENEGFSQMKSELGLDLVNYWKISSS